MRFRWPDIRACHGITLTELLIAMSMSGVAIGITMTAWHFVSNHTIRNRHKTIFEDQVARINNMVRSRFEKCDYLMEWDDDYARIVSEEGDGDTVMIEYQYDSLYIDEAAVPMVAPTARVSGFNLERFNEDDINPEFLLKMTIGFVDDFGDTSSLTNIIMVREQVLLDGETFGDPLAHRESRAR